MAVKCWLRRRHSCIKPEQARQTPRFSEKRRRVTVSPAIIRRFLIHRGVPRFARISWQSVRMEAGLPPCHQSSGFARTEHKDQCWAPGSWLPAGSSSMRRSFSHPVPGPKAATLNIRHNRRAVDLPHPCTRVTMPHRPRSERLNFTHMTTFYPAPQKAFYCPRLTLTFQSARVPI